MLCSAWNWWVKRKSPINFGSHAASPRHPEPSGPCLLRSSAPTPSKWRRQQSCPLPQWQPPRPWLRMIKDSSCRPLSSPFSVSLDTHLPFWISISICLFKPKLSNPSPIPQISRKRRTSSKCSNTSFQCLPPRPSAPRLRHPPPNGPRCPFPSQFPSWRPSWNFQNDFLT